MKLAVMQPYFFPYLGYFDLLNIVDEWIVFDVAQYIRHGWVNRNRVLHPVSGWWYITVPLKKHHFTTPINQIEISHDVDWRTRIFRQLQHYKKDAPYYAEVIAFLEECFSGLSNNLAEVNTTLFRKVAGRLGIERPIHVLSEMTLVLEGPIITPGDWGWAIAQAVGADEFINRPGGAGFIDETGYRERGIKLTFQSFANMTYTCGKYHQFEPGMSIIDVMMWNAPEQIKRYLDTWRLGQE
ncbi:MAG: WbqC family protein [Chloroflexi bacterium]|nr:WbqC family protein [Chloroflexota bacterium]